MPAERLGAAPNVDHALDALLDELQRRQNPGDPLAAEILEIARLEDAQHVILDVLRERLLLCLFDARREQPGRFLNGLRSIENLLCCTLGGVDRRVELARGARLAFAEGAG